MARLWTRDAKEGRFRAALYAFSKLTLTPESLEFWAAQQAARGRGSFGLPGFSPGSLSARDAAAEGAPQGTEVDGRLAWLFTRYVRTGSPKEIDLAYGTRKRLEEAWAAGTLTVADLDGAADQAARRLQDALTDARHAPHVERLPVLKAWAAKNLAVEQEVRGRKRDGDKRRVAARAGRDDLIPLDELARHEQEKLRRHAKGTFMLAMSPPSSCNRGQPVLLVGKGGTPPKKAYVDAVGASSWDVGTYKKVKGSYLFVRSSGSTNEELAAKAIARFTGLPATKVSFGDFDPEVFGKLRTDAIALLRAKKTGRFAFAKKAKDGKPLLVMNGKPALKIKEAALRSLGPRKSEWLEGTWTKEGTSRFTFAATSGPAIPAGTFAMLAAGITPYSMSALQLRRAGD